MTRYTKSILIVLLTMILGASCTCTGNGGPGPDAVSLGPDAGVSVPDTRGSTPDVGGPVPDAGVPETNARDTAPDVGGPSPDTSRSGSLVQYTPNQANWDTFATKPFESGTNTSHDPDGVGWISAEAWKEAEWDGTVYNPSQMTPKAFAKALCPSVDRLRGIREVFYKHNPFADPKNPTKAEVDEWHRIAINHLRALIGYTSEDRKIHPDHCLFARALWGQQRRYSTMWDQAYPGRHDSAYGPCKGGRNAHCGATFIPNPEDQVPYLPPGHDSCGKTAGSEGVFNGPKSNIPWSLKWSRGFCNTLLAEGYWGGHVGPWFHREKFGFSFWDGDPSNNDNNAGLRAKWGGKRMPNLYCNPKDADCDPANTGPNRQP